ncbi:MAG: HEAT repeat domain-containing protein, partial [Acidimicrobiia bacterium]
KNLLEGLDLSGAEADYFDLLAEQVPDPDAYLGTGVEVMRELLRIENRLPRFRRLLRIWSGKIVQSIRARDFKAAGAWLRAVTDEPTYSQEFREEVERAVDHLAEPGLLREMAVSLVEAERLEAAASLLSAWGPRLAAYLVALLAEEDSAAHRSLIVDALALVGRTDTRVLTGYLNDPRWYVVRNLAIAIGRTGRSQAVPALQAVLSHPDHRVRVEALRALVPLVGSEAIPILIGAFDDPDLKVRQTAISLLRASGSPQVVAGLVGVVEQKKLAAAEMRQLVDVIADHGGPEASAALSRLASRRFVFGGARAARDAAREALQRVRP